MKTLKILSIIFSLFLISACKPATGVAPDFASSAGCTGLCSELQFFGASFASYVLPAATSLGIEKNLYGNRILSGCQQLEILAKSSNEFAGAAASSTQINLTSSAGGTFYLNGSDCGASINPVTSVPLSNYSFHYRAPSGLPEATAVTITAADASNALAPYSYLGSYYANTVYTTLSVNSITSVVSTGSCYRVDTTFFGNVGFFTTTANYTVSAAEPYVTLYSDSACTSVGVTGTAGDLGKTFYYKFSDSAPFFASISLSTSFSSFPFVSSQWIFLGPTTASDLKLYAETLSTACTTIGITQRSSVGVLLLPATTATAVNFSATSGFFGGDAAACASSTSNSLTTTFLPGEIFKYIYYKKSGAGADTITASSAGLVTATLTAP